MLLEFNIVDNLWAITIVVLSFVRIFKASWIFDSVWESKDEVAKLIEELTVRLERLRNDKMLERKALEAENLNKSLGFRPVNPGSIFVI